MMSTMLGGDAFSSNVAAAPNRSGNTASPPRPKVNASGGEPTNTSSGVTPKHLLRVAVGDDQQIAMEVHRGLRLTGRAGREAEQGDVVPPGSHRLVLHGLVERDPVELGVVVGRAVEPDHLREIPALLGAGDELVHQPRVAQRQSDLGLVDDLRQLAGPQHRHRVDDDCAGLGRRQPAGDHRRVVGRSNQHTMARLHAVVLGERVRQAVGPVGELLVGAPPPVADQRRVVAESLLDQTIGQLDGGVEVLGVVEAVEQQLGPFVERREMVARERVDVSGGTELHQRHHRRRLDLDLRPRLDQRHDLHQRHRREVLADDLAVDAAELPLAGHVLVAIGHVPRQPHEVLGRGPALGEHARRCCAAPAPPAR